jgi:hypothetical protein
MATSYPFVKNQNITLEKSKVITVTRRTIYFSGNVYQTQNIEKFSVEKVDIGTISPGSILLLIIFGFILTIFSNTVADVIGGLLIFTSVVAIVWNFYKPKYYGLLLTSISGEKKLFPTTDKAGLRETLSAIRDLLDARRDNILEITISNSSITVIAAQGDFLEKDIVGNVVTGDMNIFIQAEERLTKRDDK